MQFGILYVSIALISFFFAIPCSAQKELYAWEVLELDFEANKIFKNAYVEGLPEDGEAYLTVDFTGVSGDAEGKKYKVAGFWDGIQTWKVRFAPPASGKWRYHTSSKDSAMDGKQGEFTCADWSDGEKQANPTRRGFLYVNRTEERKGRYFVYADGTPFLWIGDTWWNWSNRGIPFERFKTLADDRADKGFTLGQLFFAGRGWGDSSSFLDETFVHPDLKHIQHVEAYIRYANSKGLSVWIHPWWSSKDMDKTLGEENLRRWWRFVIHRLSAYNVTWVVAGEYNMNDYAGFDLEFWKNISRLIQKEDPYKRMISAHPTPPAWHGGADAPQWSTAEVLNGEDWLDYNQCQTGHSRWRNEMTPEIVRFAYSAEPAKPIVVTEPWYEFTQMVPSAMEIRFGLWSALLSGAAGHSYAGGHVWKAHVPEAPVGEDYWPMEMSFDVNTLDYPGARAMGFASKLLQKKEWWKLEPHPEYVLENPSKFCAANDGKEYLVYLRYGGTAKIDLRNTDAKNQFQFKWIDLSDGQTRLQGKTPGGKIVSLSPPEDYPTQKQYKDWLVHIWKD